MLDIKEIAQIRPSGRQLRWHEMEFYSFIHFGMNTFTDREWGLGDEDPKLFNPTELNADQWVNACVAAGMKGLILTCKHHDGFCLWPSKYTEHSVKNTPWKNGQGNVVKEVAEACKKGGIKFGIYLSPWDRHEKTYGDSEVYNRYFMNQLTELLTNYGEIFCVWFDGACGEGANGKLQVYDWDSYYELIRRLQPNAVISVCGPDVRWCGNEAGECRTSEWCVVPVELQDCEKIAKHSQKVDDGTFSRKVSSRDEDLGSRKAIDNAQKLVWYPAEVNTSIRPGWFYHASEDDKVRSQEELLAIYYGSVGGNASFLLNIPPDKRGLVHENDVMILKEFGATIARNFETNLLEDSTLTVSQSMDESHKIQNVLNKETDSYWCPASGTEAAVIEIDFHKEQTFNMFVMMEHIQSGQRIEEYSIEVKVGGKWEKVYKGTTIGYKRICRFAAVKAQYVRLSIEKSRWQPTLSCIGIFYGA